MKLKIILIITFVSAGLVLGQFKNQITKDRNVGDVMVSNNQSNLLLGFLNLNNFRMFHQYNLSFTTFGGNSLALGVYTNSMFYKISDPLDVQLDVSIMHSPYSSFGKQFQNDLSGIFISKAALNWRPSDDFFLSIQYRNIPYNYGFYNPFYRYSGFRDFRYDDEGFNDWYIGR